MSFQTEILLDPIFLKLGPSRTNLNITRNVLLFKQPEFNNVVTAEDSERTGPTTADARCWGYWISKSWLNRNAKGLDIRTSNPLFLRSSRVDSDGRRATCARCPCSPTLTSPCPSYSYISLSFNSYIPLSLQLLHPLVPPTLTSSCPSVL